MSWSVWYAGGITELVLHNSELKRQLTIEIVEDQIINLTSIDENLIVLRIGDASAKNLAIALRDVEGVE